MFIYDPACQMLDESSQFTEHEPSVYYDRRQLGDDPETQNDRFEVHSWNPQRVAGIYAGHFEMIDP